MKALLIILASLSCFAKNKIEVLTEPVSSKISIFDSNHNSRSLDEFEGYTLLVTFWATWCAPCQQELPMLADLQKDFRKLKFKVVLISEDYQGYDYAKRYLDSLSIKDYVLFHDEKNTLFNFMKLQGLPVSFLVNNEGIIKRKFTGYINWYDDKIREIILGFIPGNKPFLRNSGK